MTKPWWSKIKPDLLFQQDGFIFSWYKMAMFLDCCENNKIILNKRFHLYLSEENLNKLQDELKNSGAKEICKFTPSNTGQFLTTNGIIDIGECPEFNKFNCWIHTVDTSEIETFSKIFESYVSIQSPTGSVKMLCYEGGSIGYYITDVGIINCKFISDNYSDDVIKAYEMVKRELQSSSPTGRLTLLHGDPGTGKSFFIKSLISEIPSCWFVFVPSFLITNLSSPELLPTLLNEKGNRGGSLVLILEDADSALVKRESGNLSQISNLLSIGDGLLGELADIRIIASTNAKSVQLDEAIVRPGRLSQKIHFPHLNKEQAKKIYKNLTEKEYDGKAGTLAEIYREAREDGWIAEKNKSSTNLNISLQDVLSGNYL